jgi:2-oxoglutarate dehydrogenase E2 component (dihydrolipoamide succinyltransferase)
MIDIRVPEAGESITQVELARWLVSDGDFVEKDQEIAEIDSDKATLTMNAADSGMIRIIIEEGSTIEPGRVIGQIDPSVKNTKKKEPQPSAAVSDQPRVEEPAGPVAEIAEQDENQEPEAEGKAQKEVSPGSFTITPQAKKLMDDLDVNLDDIDQNPSNKRITKKDLLLAIAAHANTQDQNTQIAQKPADPLKPGWSGSRNAERIKMSTLRKKIAERLVAVKNETAMLTTFNEVDMSAIIELRNNYKDRFFQKYNIKPGFMSFFAKAVTLALKSFPQINGQIDEGHIIIPDYVDIGIAVSTPKGLMVPVIRDAQSKSIYELEKEIASLATKARDNKITIEELTGGTFSITNGGVFGSMLSTPIINPPQSAILGMHNIVDRPVAIHGKVEIRPVMYVALSYDHRIIDGRESVSFLVKVKEYLENPVNMLFTGRTPAEVLLDI